MLDQPIENFSSRFNFAAPRVDFDASNPAHRKAALRFFQQGIWEIKFNSKWPCVTVPQTVLMALAEHACQKELKQFHKEAGKEYKAGDPFNLHTHIHRVPLEVTQNVSFSEEQKNHAVAAYAKAVFSSN